MDISKIKLEIVEALFPLKPKRVVLFDNYAYGIPSEDSNLDILVIKNNYSDKWEEKRNIRMPKDILLEKEDYFLSYNNEKWINTALYDARNNGEILYEQK